MLNRICEQQYILQICLIKINKYYKYYYLQQNLLMSLFLFCIQIIRRQLFSGSVLCTRKQFHTYCSVYNSVNRCLDRRIRNTHGNFFIYSGLTFIILCTGQRKHANSPDSGIYVYSTSIVRFFCYRSIDELIATGQFYCCVCCGVN